VSQDKDQWSALVNTVMKLRVFSWLHNWLFLKKGSVPCERVRDLKNLDKNNMRKRN
jgi:hypothetical protein